MNPIEEAFFNKIKIRKKGWNKNAYLLYINDNEYIDETNNVFDCNWSFRADYGDNYVKLWEIYNEDKQLIEFL